jgi:regulatory protein
MAARPPLSLKARAVQWLAQREHSRLELRRKLLRAARQRDEAGADARGAGAEAPDRSAEVDALLDWLVVNKHLSEARFVESRVHARSARFGALRIVQELAQHGSALDAATAEQLKASELGRARTIWQRKFGAAPPAAGPAERAKQMRFLAGRGFSAEVIRRVVRGTDED